MEPLGSTSRIPWTAASAVIPPPTIKYVYFTMVALRKWRAHTQRKRSEICIQDDAITGLAGFEAGEGLVNLAHRIVFGLWRHAVSRREVEHRCDVHRRAGR